MRGGYGIWKPSYVFNSTYSFHPWTPLMKCRKRFWNIRAFQLEKAHIHYSNSVFFVYLSEWDWRRIEFSSYLCFGLMVLLSLGGGGETAMEITRKRTSTKHCLTNLYRVDCFFVTHRKINHMFHGRHEFSIMFCCLVDMYQEFLFSPRAETEEKQFDYSLV